jgi:hypothetical protein
MSETSDDASNCEIVVFYRDAPLNQDTEAPMDDIGTHLFDDRLSWDALFKQRQPEQYVQVISMTHTAREVGDRHEQVAWYVSGGGCTEL